MTSTEIIITLAIVAGMAVAAAIMQWSAMRNTRRENMHWLKENARLENELADVTAKYENEKQHTSWAIGRVKDLSSLNRGLERALKTASTDRYRQWNEKTKNVTQNDECNE